VTASLHPAASHHLPVFITAPGDTDVLMVVVAIFLVAAVVGFGVLFLRLHSLPERIAHRGHKIQFEIVAVLGLIALFTHIHLFWVAALLLALIDIPDFGGSLGRIAGSVEKMAGVKPGEGAADVPGDALFSAPPDDRTAEPARDTVAGIQPGTEAPRDKVAMIRRGEGTGPELAPAGKRS
jgi:hypothetical protein